MICSDRNCDHGNCRHYELHEKDEYCGMKFNKITPPDWLSGVYCSVCVEEKKEIEIEFLTEEEMEI